MCSPSHMSTLIGQQVLFIRNWQVSSMYIRLFTLPGAESYCICQTSFYSSNSYLLSIPSFTLPTPFPFVLYQQQAETFKLPLSKFLIPFIWDRNNWCTLCLHFRFFSSPHLISQTLARNLVASQEAEHLFGLSSCVEPTIKESRLKNLICIQNTAYSGKIKLTADLILKANCWRRRQNSPNRNRKLLVFALLNYDWSPKRERLIEMLIWHVCSFWFDLLVFFLGFMLAQSVMWAFELSLQFSQVPVLATTLVCLCESGDFITLCRVQFWFISEKKLPACNLSRPNVHEKVCQEIAAYSVPWTPTPCQWRARHSPPGPASECRNRGSLRPPQCSHRPLPRAVRHGWSCTGLRSEPCSSAVSASASRDHKCQPSFHAWCAPAWRRWRWNNRYDRLPH